jgi:predicted ABC-type ATPase
MPSLFILAGANGSGKTTFYFSARENNFISSTIPFVNVDMIAKEELRGYSAEMSTYDLQRKGWRTY